MTNEEHLDSLNPQKKQLFDSFLAEVESTGWKTIITQSYRSFAKQNELHTLNSSNASAGTSAHNYGYAIDCNFIKDGFQFKKATDKNIWLQSGIPNIAEKHGLRWGGNFDSYAGGDPIHFDCITDPKCTQRWLNYLIKTYKTNYDKQETNKMRWLF